MNSGQIGVALVGATTLFALWAAIFATRADRATRRAIKLADRRWEASTRPVPHVTFTDFVSPGQSIQVQVENLGGTLAGGGVIVQNGDEIYAGELNMPEKTPARPISLPFVVKAWQPAGQPRRLPLVAPGVGGPCRGRTRSQPSCSAAPGGSPPWRGRWRRPSSSRRHAPRR